MKEYIVPNLYDGLNLHTIPKIIIDEFYKLGYWYPSAEDIFYKPYFKIYEFDTDNETVRFYTHENADKFIYYNIIEKKVLNEDYEVINYDKFLREYIKEYGKGFYNGFTNFSNELKNNENQIFNRDNKQLAHKIFSRIIDRKEFRYRESFPTLTYFTLDIEKLKSKFKNYEDYHVVSKNSYYKSGFDSGERYKAWSLILHNPTLFEDIFIKQLKQPEIKEEVKEKDTIIETPTLNLKNIPNFTLQQRYNLFEQLGFDSIIHQLNTEKQGAKHKLLALILGISPDNAKHLLNGTYKEFTKEQQEEVEEFLNRNKIKL